MSTEFVEGIVLGWISCTGFLAAVALFEVTRRRLRRQQAADEMIARLFQQKKQL